MFPFGIPDLVAMAVVGYALFKLGQVLRRGTKR
jgi:hypothetical protein